MPLARAFFWFFFCASSRQKKNKAKPYTYGESEKKETTFELLGYMDVSDVPGDERVKTLEGDYEVITEETMLD